MPALHIPSPCVRAPSQPKFGWGSPIALLDQDPLPFFPYLLLAAVHIGIFHAYGGHALFIPSLSLWNLSD